MTTPFTGKPLDRVDGRAKVMGKATYTGDVAIAGLVHAVFVGSTIARGKIAAINTRAAERAPGVRAVLTHANAPRLPNAGARKSPNERRVQILQDDAVLYDGQPVAVVVADTLEQARAAAALVQVRYDEERPVIELAQAKDTVFVPHPSGPRPPSDSSRGDFDAAFAAAPVQVDETYATPFENHNPLERHATVAAWQGDKVTIYDATQWVFGVQRRIASVFDVPRENVRVVTRFVGGAFGCKGSPWSHVFLAAMAAKVVGRPVKLEVERSQMFQMTGYRPVTEQRVSLGAARDGRLLAVRHDVLSQTSRFDEFMEPSAYATRMIYACPDVKTTHRLARFDASTPTFMRAPGESSGMFALESAMDELAWALGMDPVALRLKCYAETDPDENKPFSSKSLRECYRAAGERFGWAARAPRVRATKDGPWLVGWGMASATYPARQSPASALARIRADGTAIVLVGTEDIGTGTYTVMTQVAADALGIPFDRVRLDLGDTDYPEAPIEAGSQTASSVGSAVKKACLAAKDAMAKLAVADPRSPLHGMRPEDLDAEDGALVARKTRARDAYADVLARAGQPHVEAKVDEKEKEERKRYSCHAFGAHFVEAAVDEALGTVRVRRVVSAFGCGTVLNAKTARSQLLGGIVWGIGMALMEETVRDARTARVVTKGLDDYHVPVNADVGAIDVLMLDERDPYVNEVGAKGMGEIGIVGVAAAIANAVYHATGKRVRKLPITLDALL